MAWELITLPKEMFSLGFRPAVVPLNESEIVILGGFGLIPRSAVIIIFNVTTKECRKVAETGL